MKKCHPLWSILLLIFVFSGCSSIGFGTLRSNYGPIPGGGHLLQMVVTTDQSVVAKECDKSPATVSGCFMARQLVEQRVYTIKIVKKVSELPSDFAFEIDVHETCHLAAFFQIGFIDDPCHIGNNGMIQVPQRKYMP